MKTKEQIAKYNKEYFARPEVITRAKIRNAQRRNKRQEYKKTKAGKLAEKRYSDKPETKALKEWSRVKNRYGITKEDFDTLMLNQNGVCAICFTKTKTRLHIDHSHKTGKVRGLLCGNCNRALGLFYDNCSILLSAVKYLYGK
jgi:hypothetical protein